MDTNSQILFNILLGVSSFLSGFVMFAVWNRLGRIEREAKDLHILVVGKYIERTEVTVQLEKIYTEIKGLHEAMLKQITRREGDHRDNG